MKRGKILITISLLIILLLVGCMPIENPNGNLPGEDPGINNPGNDDPSNSGSDDPSNPGDENPEDPEPVKKAMNITNYVSEENEVPKIIINTDNYVFPYNKEDYVKGSLKIVEQPNTENVIFEEASMGIRLRGNSTYECPKKAFRIKFDKKQSLFDLPKAKSWVLLANYFDKTQMRNYLAYLTANKLDNLAFQPSSIFVEVEINGEYQGLYLLCEQMQTGEGRVDIEQDEFDISNPSAFMELDFLDRILADGLVENVSYFRTHDLYFALKYPDEDDITAERCQAIKSFMDKAFDKIYSSHNYDRYIDVDSFIDYYLINEMFKNVDSVQTSVYFYLENNKLYAGPVWDFDIALGVVGKNETSSIYEVYQNSKMWLKNYSKYYKPLFNDSEFLEKVKARYKEVRPLLVEVYSELLIAQEILKEEIARDLVYWPIPGEMYMWLAGQYSSEYMKLQTYDAHIEFLKKQLNIQFINMDQEFLN